MRTVRIIFAAILFFVFLWGGVAWAAEQKMPGEGPLSGVSIGIDPGHQKKANYGKEPIAPGSRKMKHKVSAGAAGVVTRIPEHETNLTIALLLRDALKAQGATVYMTRTKADVNISNVARAKMMNKHGVDLVLRLHGNSSSDRKKQGITIYVRASGAKKKESDKAAKYLLKKMTEATGAHDRGVKYTNDYTGLNWSKVPSVLIEMGYLSNRREDVLLNSPKYQAKLVKGMVEGVKDYILERRMPPILESLMVTSFEVRPVQGQ